VRGKALPKEVIKKATTTRVRVLVRKEESDIFIISSFRLVRGILVI
jgi:hypothetical protein